MNEFEAAKYPFLSGANAFVDETLTLEALGDRSYSKLLKRAEDRVTQTIILGHIEPKLSHTVHELMAYPLTKMFIVALALETDYLIKRHALAEATRARTLLMKETDEYLQAFSGEYGWVVERIDYVEGMLQYRFNLKFNNYLKNAAQFRATKWKLINRPLHEGFVPLTKAEFVRLLQEEVRRRIEAMEVPKGKLPEPLQKRVEALGKLYAEYKPRLTQGDLPPQLILGSMPPCVTHAYEGLKAGQRLGHMERFALTTFLVHSGMSIDAIVKLFVSVTDFNESFTRYQVEHIAGKKGGRVKYTPPMCDTMRTHAACHNPDDLCKEVRHPLSYYRRKIKGVKK